MPELFREVATGDIDPALLGLELAATSGQDYFVNIETGLDVNGAVDLAKDRVRVYSESAINEVTVDAAIAAHPSLGAIVADEFAMAADTSYTLIERPLKEGETIVYDVHIHLSMGDASSFKSVAADWYVEASRETGGSVRTQDTSSMSLGKLPGFRLSSEGTATTMKIVMWTQRSGDVTIHRRDMEVWSQGSLA